jgi:hypothetical protein
VHQDDALELVVDVRILDQARERRKPGAGRQQQQAPSGDEVVGNQGAGRLAPYQDDIALPDFLQT